MVFVPDFQLGVLNGWLPFAAYAVIFGITIFFFPKEVRRRLYVIPVLTTGQRVLRMVGKLIALAGLILFVLSPLRFDLWAFPVGVFLWLAGNIGLVIALLNYSSTPLDSPVTGGIYRISRNPQIFSIWVIFMGVSLMTGSVLTLLVFGAGLVFLHQTVLAEERTCRKQYGESYRDFTERVPRYFLLF